MFYLSLFAHAFGQKYDIPIPLNLAIFALASVLFFTFTVTSLILPDVETGVARINLTGKSAVRWLSQQKWIGSLIKIFILAFCLLILSSAVFGSSDTSFNLAPTFFWDIFWVALPLLAVLFGNFWQAINPWKTIYGWIARFKKPSQKYPASWGIWPAVILYGGFIWFELASTIGYYPRVLAAILAVYSAVMLVGAARYGRAWLDNAEVFSVISRLVGSIAILDYTKGKFGLQTPGAGLLRLAYQPGLLFFVGVFIAGVSFDGFKETSLWQTLTDGVAVPISASLGLLSMLEVFLAIYYLIMQLIKKVVKTRLSVMDLVRNFAVSLIPIAVAYTLAHYFSLLFITGQDFIRLLSDPFGTGANYLGSADYQVNIGLIGAKTLWYIQLSLVLFGHMLGVYIGHLIAIKSFKNVKTATHSQYPVLILMIALTSFALYILSAQTSGL